LKHAQKLFFDRVIDTKPAEGDTARLAAVEPAAPAYIARNVVIAARIVDGQFLTAASAADQPSQQSRAALAAPACSVPGRLPAIIFWIASERGQST
jgi:hypothetical protein